MAKSAALATGGNVKASRIVEKEGTEGAMKSYLNPHDRFATRMKASMTGKVEADSHQNDEQNALFVDGAQIAVDDVDKGKYLPLS